MSDRINNYYNLDRSSRAVAKGTHRQLIGGFWEELGELQFEFVRERGLARDDRVLDIGCGCLRGGVHFVRYLEPRCYFGMDLSQDLLDAGYDSELAMAGLANKVARENLLASDSFEFDRFGVQFDVAIAISLFTHLPLNHIKLCLTRLAAVTRPGAGLYATFFLCPPGHDWATSVDYASGPTTHPARDPYHYEAADLSWLCSLLPWTHEIVGNWNHPRDQQMVIFRRTDA